MEASLSIIEKEVIFADTHEPQICFRGLETLTMRGGLGGCKGRKSSRKLLTSIPPKSLPSMDICRYRTWGWCVNVRKLKRVTWVSVFTQWAALKCIELTVITILRFVIFTVYELSRVPLSKYCDLYILHLYLAFYISPPSPPLQQPYGIVTGPELSHELQCWVGIKIWCSSILVRHSNCCSTLSIPKKPQSNVCNIMSKPFQLAQSFRWRVVAKIHLNSARVRTWTNLPWHIIITPYKSNKIPLHPSFGSSF